MPCKTPSEFFVHSNFLFPSNPVLRVAKHPLWGDRQMGHSEGPGRGREHGQVHREFDDRCVPRRTGSGGRVTPSNNKGLYMVI